MASEVGQLRNRICGMMYQARSKDRGVLEVSGMLRAAGGSSATLGSAAFRHPLECVTFGGQSPSW